MPRQRFTVPANTGPGPEFEIVGTREGQEVTEVFHCLPKAPGIALTEMLGAIDANMGARVSSVLRFIRAVIVPEDEERFFTVAWGKDPVIPDETWSAVMDYLLGVYLRGRPFLTSEDPQPSGDSSPSDTGPNGTQNGSGDVVSLPERTSSSSASGTATT